MNTPNQPTASICIHDLTQIHREVIPKMEDLLDQLRQHTDGKEQTPEVSSILRFKSEVEASIKHLQRDLHEVHLPAFNTTGRAEKREKLRNELNDLALSIRKRRLEMTEPFPVGAFNRLLENNIFEKILIEYITEASDVTSSCFACPAFSEILVEKRIQHFLPKVLRMQQDRERRDTEECANKLENLNYLGVRGVSKICKNIADLEIFQVGVTDAFWCKTFNTLIDYYGQTKEANVCSFQNVRDVRHALKFLHGYDGKDLPILRELFIDESNLRAYTRERLAAFHESVFKFLDLHGSSIWSFSYIGRNEYLPFHGMIKRMPNLKKLDFCDALPTEYEAPDELEDEVIANMEAELLANPLPHLPSLIYLSSCCEGLMEQIFQKCHNLKTVIIDEFLLNGFDEAVATELQNLCLDRFESRMDLFLCVSNRVSWPLKRLRLRYDTPGKCSILWPALNRFQHTIEHLEIDIRIQRDDSKVLLKLPRLKHLKFCIDAGTVGLDDFVHLKSLETLIVDGIRRMEEMLSRPQDKITLVQIFGKVKEMQTSNIWDCFANLRELEFARSGRHDLKYTRQGATVSQYYYDKIEMAWILENVHENIFRFKETEAEPRDDHDAFSQNEVMLIIFFIILCGIMAQFLSRLIQ